MNAAPAAHSSPIFGRLKDARSDDMTTVSGIGGFIGPRQKEPEGGSKPPEDSGSDSGSNAGAGDTSGTSTGGTDQTAGTGETSQPSAAASPSETQVVTAAEATGVSTEARADPALAAAADRGALGNPPAGIDAAEARAMAEEARQTFVAEQLVASVTAAADQSQAGPGTDPSAEAGEEKAAGQGFADAQALFDGAGGSTAAGAAIDRRA